MIESSLREFFGVAISYSCERLLWIQLAEENKGPAYGLEKGYCYFTLPIWNARGEKVE